MLKEIVRVLNFNDENRTHNLKMNIFISYVTKIVTLGITFLVVPLTINYVNSTKYGIWLTLSSIVSWLSFFDMGFGNGMRNRFSEAKARNLFEKARTYISTTYIIVFIIFSIVGILFFGINFFLDWTKILNAPKYMLNELSQITLIVISGFCLQMVLRLITTVLIADQKAGFASFIEMTSQLLTLIVIVFLIYFTKGSLILLAIALSLPPVVVYIFWSIYFFSKDYKIYLPKVKYFDTSVVTDTFKLGSKFFVTQTTMLIIYASSNVIISQYLNPNQVTIYNISYKYFSVVIILFSIMMPAIWSAITEAWSNNDINWIKLSLKKMIKVWMYFVILTVFMLLISKIVFRIWVGKDIIIPFHLSISFAIFSIIGSWNSIWGNFLNGTGKIKLQTFISIVKCVIYFPITILLVKKFGLLGISLGFIIINLPDAIIFPLQSKKILNHCAKGIWNS